MALAQGVEQVHLSACQRTAEKHWDVEAVTSRRAVAPSSSTGLLHQSLGLSERTLAVLRC